MWGSPDAPWIDAATGAGFGIPHPTMRLDGLGSCFHWRAVEKGLQLCGGVALQLAKRATGRTEELKDLRCVKLLG